MLFFLSLLKPTQLKPLEQMSQSPPPQFEPGTFAEEDRAQLDRLCFVNLRSLITFSFSTLVVICDHTRHCHPSKEDVAPPPFDLHGIEIFFSPLVTRALLLLSVYPIIGGNKLQTFRVFKSHGASTVLSMSMISLIRIFFFT
jgi:hypothetical protein